MRTSDLILRLGNNLTPIEPNYASKRLNHALSIGLASSTALLVVLYGIRSDMPELLLTTMFWVRLAFPVATLITGLNLAGRLGRPGAPVRLAWFAVTLLFIVMLLVATFTVLATPPGYRLQLMLGTTWRVTTANIVLLSLPSLAAVMHALKGLAPTRLILAGTGAGLLAGAQSLLVYSLYCSEMSIPFWGVWYVLGISITAGLGALLGSLYLRW
ncbi:hypothetical protein B0G81_2280 [Paraburkholderia sp. BL6665CI2N2]|uniref:DUF1109 domain-containing protein n=1 Tax=Paraburkholderia sp. BL6665CI2N2 TaxID=1938806 RepID=UPI001066B6E6|nr:DUF1109 domain-containing protein [Paraburkholderia sp. BL6665CI2N2]TDY22011.1 hypothetical protein B0G81_2280 [Paraburkholderia sp. BL6665CI2N2]